MPSNISLYLKICGGILAILLLFGIGYKVVAPTYKTVVGQGGRVVTINQDTPKIPLVGCALWRLNAKVYWETNRKEKAPVVK